MRLTENAGPMEPIVIAESDFPGAAELLEAYREMGEPYIFCHPTPLEAKQMIVIAGQPFQILRSITEGELQDFTKGRGWLQLSPQRYKEHYYLMVTD
jgi:hypothetical protein